MYPNNSISGPQLGEVAGPSSHPRLSTVAQVSQIVKECYDEVDPSIHRLGKRHVLRHDHRRGGHATGRNCKYDAAACNDLHAVLLQPQQPDLPLSELQRMQRSLQHLRVLHLLIDVKRIAGILCGLCSAGLWNILHKADCAPPAQFFLLRRLPQVPEGSSLS